MVAIIAKKGVNVTLFRFKDNIQEKSLDNINTTITGRREILRQFSVQSHLVALQL